MASILKPVGAGGSNLRNDVMTVQYLLNCIPSCNGGPLSELWVDGKVQGANFTNTVASIRRFQQRIFKGWSDGRVDPDGQTLMRMNLWDPAGGPAGGGNSKPARYGGTKGDGGQGYNGKGNEAVSYGQKDGGFKMPQGGFASDKTSQPGKNAFNDPFNQKGGYAFDMAGGNKDTSNEGQKDANEKTGQPNKSASNDPFNQKGGHPFDMAGGNKGSRSHEGQKDANEKTSQPSKSAFNKPFNQKGGQAFDMGSGSKGSPSQEGVKDAKEFTSG